MLQNFLRTIAVLLIGSPLIGVSSAQAEDSVLVAQIDSAGRQGMLVQQIGRAACYVLGDIEKDRNKKLALDGIAEFTKVQEWLRYGHSVKNWPAATNRALIANLEDVDGMWATLKAADSQLAYGDFHTIVVHQVMVLTDSVMEATNETVTTLRGLTDVGPVDPSYLRTLDAAGRQRLLTQRATKEFCFAALISNTADHRGILSDAVHEFERVLDDLLTGQGDLIAPPNVMIQAQLERTQSTWNKLVVLFDLIGKGQSVSKQQMIEAAALSDRVLNQMNAVAFAYAHLHQ
ncbi:MAG: type IV pili methyl-accepting chemotaxis transducer N-terminal domain-containing protein [Paracoccaceae bacterium]